MPAVTTMASRLAPGTATVLYEAQTRPPRHPAHSQDRGGGARAERLCQPPRSILRSAGLIPCGGGMALQACKLAEGMAATDKHPRGLEETPCSRRYSCGGFERDHPVPCVSTHRHEDAWATEIDRIKPFSPICLSASKRRTSKEITLLVTTSLLELVEGIDPATQPPSVDPTMPISTSHTASGCGQAIMLAESSL